MAISQATPNDASAIAGVHVATWRATYAGIIPHEFLASLSTEQRSQFWRERIENPALSACLFVATTPQEGVVGFVAGGPERTQDPEYTGEVHAIYVLPSRQGIGLGRRLFRAAARALADAQLRSLLVWVLEANPSRGFYESLGGRQVRRRTIEIGGAQLAEVGYGWDDTAVLIRMGARKRRPEL